MHSVAANLGVGENLATVDRDGIERSGSQPSHKPS